MGYLFWAVFKNLRNVIAKKPLEWIGDFED